MSSLETSSTLRFTLRRYNNSDNQSLQFRSSFWHRHFSRFPSDELPYDILYEIRRRVVTEETVILDEAPASRGAAETAIERLKREKFDAFGGEELGDCCVCFEELKEGEKEVSRIGCGHVYHKSCILTWVRRNLSCPLCRRKIE